MRRMMIFLVLLALPAVCCAEIYKWVDERGQVGYADDLGKVPAKYRKSATLVNSQEPAVEIIEKNEGEKEPHKGGEARQGQAATGEEKTKAKAKPLYDGKDGETWKRDFARQKNDIKSLEENAAGIRARMANPGKMSRGEYLTLQNTVRDLEVRISTAQKKLEDLTSAADRAEVPAEFR
ncbi:MAG TPA: DUF4124 domain-containing protein [Geobacteraceae bacterium]|nr:DUF4124 domain-containing protein [Geobacteraceae bacterium]